MTQTGLFRRTRSGLMGPHLWGGHTGVKWPLAHDRDGLMLGRIVVSRWSFSKPSWCRQGAFLRCRSMYRIFIEKRLWNQDVWRRATVDPTGHSEMEWCREGPRQQGLWRYDQRSLDAVPGRTWAGLLLEHTKKMVCSWPSQQPVSFLNQGHTAYHTSQWFVVNHQWQGLCSQRFWVSKSGVGLCF